MSWLRRLFGAGEEQESRAGAVTSSPTSQGPTPPPAAAAPARGRSEPATGPIKRERIKILAGPLIMGSTDDEAESFFQATAKVNLVDANLFDRETPQRTVMMPEIIIDKYPVTCHQYLEFCTATRHQCPENGRS